jgi:hypothetical protein
MKKTLKAKELEAILDEVGAKLEPVLKSEAEKAAERLAKAHPGESTASETPKDASATKEAPDDKSSAPPPPKPEGTPPAAKEASPPPAAPPAADPALTADPAAATDPAADPGAAGAEDPADLQAAYATLPLEDLQMHYLACKAALIAAMGNDGGADAPPAADPAAAAAPPAPPPPAAPPAAPPALKNELPSDPKANGEDPANVAKSEKDLTIASLEKRVTERDTALEQLTGALRKIVERPVRKAITSLSDLRKSDGQGSTVDLSKLSKNEQRALVRKAAEKPNLKKSDRERLNSFFFGNLEIDGVKDLLT